MLLNLKTLLNILPDAKCFRLSGNESFDILNIAHLRQFASLPTGNRILYFCVYEDDVERAGWYNRPFDRSLNIQKLSSEENLIFVVDNRVSDEQLTGVRHIRMDNIYRAIDRIRQHVLSLARPKVIGITGSVGKTTAAAIIQDVLEKKYICGRVYSKRLTPLTLSSWLSNFLTPTHQMLVLEYSMYRKNHIDILTDILTPDVSVFLNIKRMHLGVQGIDTLEDILEGKRPLVDKSGLGLLNIDDPLVSRLRRSGDLGFSLVDPKADAFVSTVGNEAVLALNYTNQVIRFVPYIKTRLFYYQASVAGLIGSLLGVLDEAVAKALEDFKPAENRINWIDVRGQKVLFDGDVTASVRLMSLAEHHYTSSVLLIHSFDFGEENVDLQVDDLVRVFSMFTEVRVLDTEENRTVVSRYSLRNIIFVTKDDFLSGFLRFEFKVLHFGTYFRKHSDLGFLMDFVAT